MESIGGDSPASEKVYGAAPNLIITSHARAFYSFFECTAQCMICKPIYPLIKIRRIVDTSVLACQEKSLWTTSATVKRVLKKASSLLSEAMGGAVTEKVPHWSRAEHAVLTTVIDLLS
jgi:hypothetical protein